MTWPRAWASDVARSSHSPRTSSVLLFSSNDDEYFSEHAEAPFRSALLLQTLLHLSYSADHFTIAQLICHSAAVLVESFSLRRGFRGEPTSGIGRRLPCYQRKVAVSPSYGFSSKSGWLRDLMIWHGGAECEARHGR